MAINFWKMIKEGLLLQGYQYRRDKNANWTNIDSNFEQVGNELNAQSNRIDNIINGVEQPSEIVDFRTDTKGVVHSTAKQRGDSDYNDLLSRTQRILYMQDFGAVGDGQTNDSEAFNKVEAQYTNRLVDLQGKTFVIEEFPRNNKYANGLFLINGQILPSGFSTFNQTSGSNIIIGTGAEFNPADEYENGMGHNIISIGKGALSSIVDSTKNTIAIGTDTLKNNKNGVYNVAVGTKAQMHVNGTLGSKFGTRNVSLGDQALMFNQDGWGNVAFGRNALQTNIHSMQNTGIGNACMYGYAPLDLDDETIINQTPIMGNFNVGVGANNMMFTRGSDNSSLGFDAMRNLKIGSRNVGIGYYALRHLEDPVSYDGTGHYYMALNNAYNRDGNTITFVMPNHQLQVGQTVTLELDGYDPVEVTISEVTADSCSFEVPNGDLYPEGGYGSISKYNTYVGTYSWSGKKITVQISSHPFENDFKVLAQIGSHEAQWFQLYNVTATSFEMDANISGNESGTFTVIEYADTTSIDPSNDNTFIGVKAGWNMNKGSFNTGVGGISLQNNKGDRNTGIGYLTLAENIDGQNNSALGYGAGRWMVDGTPAASVNNATCLGYNSRVSGDNQLQLGDGSTTPYAYQSLQLRSDERDKADIRDTVLGLDFIMKLRPVDYKLDLRDDYYEIDDEGNMVALPKDGSKKRTRYHHGLIAQEIEEIIEETGVDFGGLQHHSINGGADVYSVGYEELIGPLIKSVQELTNRLAAVEEKSGA